MFKIMIRKENGKSFRTVNEWKSFERAAFELSRLNLDFTKVAAKIVVGRKIVVTRGS